LFDSTVRINNATLKRCIKKQSVVKSCGFFDHLFGIRFNKGIAVEKTYSKDNAINIKLFPKETAANSVRT
jgi:hypothetical protein